MAALCTAIVPNPLTASGESVYLIAAPQRIGPFERGLLFLSCPTLVLSCVQCSQDALFTIRIEIGLEIQHSFSARYV